MPLGRLIHSGEEENRYLAGRKITVGCLPTRRWRNCDFVGRPPSHYQKAEAMELQPSDKTVERPPVPSHSFKLKRGISMPLGGFFPRVPVWAILTQGRARMVTTRLTAGESPVLFFENLVKVLSGRDAGLRGPSKKKGGQQNGPQNPAAT